MLYFSHAAAQAKAVQEERTVHEAQRPDYLKEEDTLESLDSSRRENDARRDELNTRKGILISELKNDDEANIKKGDTTLLDGLKEEYERWRSFNSRYGDKEAGLAR